MIISFFGHRKLYSYSDLFKKVTEVILKNINTCNEIKFYCGAYGDFDNLCAAVCRTIKATHKSELILITPYITESQQRKIKHFINHNLYDSVIYPPLEKTPLKFAISKRNEWIVNESDLIIAYVNHTYGGAYKSLLYAKRKKKNIIKE